MSIDWKEACMKLVDYVRYHSDLTEERYRNYGREVDCNYVVQDYAEDIFNDWEYAIEVLDEYREWDAQRKAEVERSNTEFRKIIDEWDKGPFGHDLRTPEGRKAEAGVPE